jgi:hypothetical protein
MEDLIIKNLLPRFQKFAALVCASFLVLWSIYVCFNEVFASRYQVLFFFALGALTVGVFTLLAFTVWLPKPSLSVLPDGIYPNLPNQSSLKPLSWTEVAEVSIGLNFLQITLKGSKNYNMDLSSLKYCDLKDVKSKVMEMCEANNISYKNA